MMKKNLPLGFLAALLVGVVVALVLTGRYATPRAMAQAQQPPAASQRYQLAAFAYPAASGAGPAMHGAYILDTQSGKVWQISQNGRLVSLGGVE